MAIKLIEIIGNNHNVPNNIQVNIDELLLKINKVRDVWALPMIVTSGLRTMEDHIRIYKDLAKQRNVPYDQSKVPMGSRHLSGQAVDIADPTGALYDWCRQNEKLLETIGLWCEEKDDQKRVHFQTVPPKSGKRFFKP